jgi:type II secretory pathway pseudopilin PulG
MFPRATDDGTNSNKFFHTWGRGVSKMGSVRCGRCGFVSFANAEHCKQCGNALPSAQAGAGAQHYPVPFQAFEGGAKKRVGLAVASLVLGVVGLPTLGLFGVGAITGIILGTMALMRVNKRPQEYGGRGLAIGGIVVNAVSLLIIPVVGIIAAIAIPNLLASRRAANEGSAISNVRALAQAEAVFSSTHDGTPGAYDDLKKAGLLAEELQHNESHGYSFDVNVEGNNFVVLATPVKYPASGVRSFYYSSDDQLIRAGNERGARASNETAPLAEYSAPPGRAGTYSPGAGDGREAAGLNP